MISVSQLQAEIVIKNSQINEFNTIISFKNENINQLLSTIDNQSSQLTENNFALASHDNNTSSLLNTIEELNSQLTTANQDIFAIFSEINQLKTQNYN